MVIEKFLSQVRDRELEKLKKRFWAKVQRSNGCWLWTGSKNQSGRGMFRVGRRTSAANRVAWELAHGPIADGLCVCHKCDVPSCVNPEHLWLGDHLENMADREEKGRNTGADFNRRKTHCPNGHPYSGDNVRVEKRGGRSCRACCRSRELARYRVEKNS
jgi:hypothetical protein